MRILLKITLFPFALILGIASNFLRFLTFVSGGLISILAYLMAAYITLILLFDFIPFSQALGGYIICFIFSPYGLFAVAHWLLNGIDTLTMKMKTI
ncbi:MAG: hypothetical protein R3Y24_14850 [Eubacteriales bacterium]